MKQDFSKSWKGSSQTRKQRKFRANAPIQVKRKFMAANLNKDLRKKHGKRSFPVRKGDLVKIMNGTNSGKKGKISIVKTKKSVVAIEGLQRSKKDGTKINLWFNPSNLQIQELNLEDKKRLKSMTRKPMIKKEKTKENKNAQDKTRNK